ncbi:hypothetical protein CEY12_09310 [Chryseobacterium sp. T16E-39]|nr:hypothetical protein CEY12_09310 [Chryseobacterium sp. T16E-39]
MNNTKSDFFACFHNVSINFGIPIDNIDGIFSLTQTHPMKNTIKKSQILYYPSYNNLDKIINLN